MPIKKNLFDGTSCELMVQKAYVSLYLQVWHVAKVPEHDKYQYTYFAHKLNSLETAPKKLLASDSRLRPDRYALEVGDLSKAGAEKSRYRIFHFFYCFFFLII